MIINKTKRLINNATVAVMQTIVSGIVLFLLYRYLLDKLGSEILGLWSVLMATTSVARLSELGVSGSVVKFVARYRALESQIDASEVVQTAFITVALFLGGICILIYPFLDDLLSHFIPSKFMSLAVDILPWALLSLFINTASGVFLSGLDGCQRVDIRNFLMIFGNLLFILMALLLLPEYGLKGVAVSQVLQSVVILIASWILLRNQINELPLLPFTWSKSRFQEILVYSVNFQINSIAVLLFDPLTKLLMSRYGGLSSAAYYEMASQLVLKLRALIIAANQALVPAVAELHEISPEKVRDLYLKSYRLLFFVAAPFYTAILIILPMVSVLWIGHSETKFLLYGALLVVGWGLNNLAGPAYFLNLGIGELKWNSIAHVVMALLNVLFGLILGSMLGGLGVVISAMIALVISSFIILFALHKRYKIPFQTILPPEHYMLLMVIFCFVAISTWVNPVYLLNQDIVVSNVINICLYLMVIGAVMWSHPYRLMLFQRFKRRA